VSADPLVGRGQALAVLARVMAAAADRRPGLLLIAGEPGIGKTALVGEFARRAAADGVRVLWGQCWDGDGELHQAAALLAGFDLDRGFRPGRRANPEPWSMAIVAEAVAAAGTAAQREEMYRRLTPLAGLHVISGGCAAYSGAYDHYLGLLAASLGHSLRAQVHFTAAATMHQQLGAAALPGADPVLDEQAKAAYRKRLTQLDDEIDNAGQYQDLYRAEHARLERKALLHELASAAGIGGRDRRLGDSAERARKTITSRIRDAIDRVQQHHPELARHLDGTISTGTWCCYTPVARR
jgi:hypothetical protein